MERLEDALTLLDQGNVPRAAELLAQLAARTPAHATVHVLLAQAYERQHRWNEALAAWQTAHLLLPEVPLVRQGSLRAARVLAALRTMTSPTPLVPPPFTAPEPPPAPAEAPQDDAHAPAWDPAPAFAPSPDASASEETDAGDAPEAIWEEVSEDEAIETTPDDEAAAFTEARFTEAVFVDDHDASAFETGVIDDVEAPNSSAWADDASDQAAFEETEDLTDAEFLDFGAPEQDAGPGAPDETTALPEVSLPWQDTSDTHGATDTHDPADASSDMDPLEDLDVFFDPPPPLSADAPEAAPPEAPGASPEAAPAPASTAQPITLPGAEIILPASASPSLPGTPDADDTSVKGPYEPFDLDDLIASLSGAGRIVPNPDPVPPPVFDEDTELDDMVSPTLARIHAAQGQFEEAARIYDRLAAQEPQRAAEHRAEAAAMREKVKGKG